MARSRAQEAALKKRLEDYPMLNDAGKAGTTNDMQRFVRHLHAFEISARSHILAGAQTHTPALHPKARVSSSLRSLLSCSWETVIFNCDGNSRFGLFSSP